MELTNRRIVVAVTGGIAAYKTCLLVRLLKKAGASVSVAMTESACRFVAPLTFEVLSGEPVALTQWPAAGSSLPHIDLTRGADLMVVVPATENFLAKAAWGIADDLVSTLAAARRCPLAVVPAMNVRMWDNPATQRAVAALRSAGVAVWGPASGFQACGDSGAGRMVEPEEVLERICAQFVPKSLAGRHVVVTAGPTLEKLDPVRALTNLSSGRQGFAVAQAAVRAGARVTLIAGPTACATPLDVQRIDVESAAQMHEAALREAVGADVFIGVAAVADWSPAACSEQKLKKGRSGPPSIVLKENPDILADVARLAQPPLCVGFAAETENIVEHARAKLAAKGLAMICANCAQQALGSATNAVTLVTREATVEIPRAGKLAVAQRIMEEIARRLA